ncbi:unnamed protein product, partial [Didymodactylos carnosus]
MVWFAWGLELCAVVVFAEPDVVAGWGTAAGCLSGSELGSG